jgi:hypothetical protein
MDVVLHNFTISVIYGGETPIAGSPFAPESAIILAGVFLFLWDHFCGILFGKAGRHARSPLALP